MRRFIKTTVCVVLLVCMLGSNALAAMEFAGYDTTNPPYYYKIMQEVIDGNYTSRFEFELLDDADVEWKFEGYEKAYPHVGYERLYLEDNAQKAITRKTNLYPQWETRYRDFMWEVCGDHRIYQRQQTKIENKYWAWDFGNDELGIPDSEVFVPTNRFAEVTDSYEDRGIANLDKDGNYVFDVTGKIYNEYLYEIYDGPFADSMPTAFNVVVDEKGNPTKQIVDGDFLSDEVLSERDENGYYVVTDEMIANYIDIPHTKFVTGPTYHGEEATKDVAAFYYANQDKTDWKWDDDTAIVYNNAEISWTAPMYEMEEPYFYYQYLVVNGLVLDGRNDTPEVYRYTGGKATPKVEWKYAFAEEAYPYQVVEIKYIENNTGEMIMAVDENGDPIVRIPTGEYANAYFVVTDTEVQLWIKDNNASHLIETYDRANGPFGDVSYGYTNGSAYVR